ncbi:MAG: carbohydrate-binding domain-containing protein [Clostridia bacterium]|nr:carbohydrate-binding domain-containing protein [Clostridia bacterium]
MKKLMSLLLSIVLASMMLASAMAADYSDVFTKYDLDASWTEAVTVTFSENGVLVNGSGAAVDGTTVYINAAGTYVLSGECANGRVQVEVDKNAKVHLVLNGLTLTCADSAPIYIVSADKCKITLADGSVNTLTDAAAYTLALDKQPNACIYAKDDLCINGNGILTVNGNMGNGIGTKNDLHIVSGNITVVAAKNALKGNDSVSIKDGTLVLNAAGDGIKADTDNKAGKGYVYIAGGSITIVSGDDGIQSATDLSITGGQINVEAEGKTVNSKGTQSIASGTIAVK